LDQPSKPQLALEFCDLPLVLPSTSKTSLTYPEPELSATFLNVYKSKISLVNMDMFMRVYKSDRAISFQVKSCPTVITGYTMKTVNPSLEIYGLPKKYREYRDIFSIQEAKSLPEH